MGIRRACPLLLAVLLLTEGLVSQTGGEATLPEGTKIRLQINDYLSTKSNVEGDVFTATVTDPVYLKDRLLIPKQTIVSGSVSRILRPGRFKGKAMMNLIFNSIHLIGNKELPIVASLVSIDQSTHVQSGTEGTIVGDDAGGKDAVKVAAPTVTGAGIGAIAGGGKGAAIGAGVGAVIGLASLARPGKDLEVKRGAVIEIVLDRPLTIPVEIIKRED